MTDRRNTDAKVQAGADDRQPLQSAALTSLAVQRDIVRHLDPKLMTQLKDAALAADRSACTTVLRKAIASGVRREDLADFYIPELARQMGDDWCSDKLGFANVTIGVSRLQSMLRDLGPDWYGDDIADPAAPAIILIVPQEVYHTLGAMVLGGQLRRKGMSVRMMVGTRPEEVADKIRRTKYDAVFISSSRGETLESLRRIVDVVKTSAECVPPIVIGGTLLEVETEYDVTTLTGADYATSNPDKALKLCGLITTPHTNAPSLRRT